MFSLVTGAAVKALVDKFNTSELVMARQLYQQLEPEDVMLADSAFGTYGDLALIKAADADAVFRKQHARKTDFRRGKKLDTGDHIVTWYKPKQRPKAIPLEVFETLPAQMRVREVRLQITQPGFRPEEIIVVTTLLDAKRYPKTRLAELYRLRWQAAEVNLKHLKTTLKMDMLLAKTPEMFRKELWMHLSAYNLLRRLIWKAAWQAKVAPLRLSLQGSRQLFNQFVPQLAMTCRKLRKRLYAHLLTVIATELVPLRPDRIEPRAKKRRPKSYPWLQEPRSTLKARLAA
jgi:hypothetical protein